MNDYVAGHLARVRHSEYLREVARDELVAQCRPAEPRNARAPKQDTIGLVRRAIAALVASLLLTLALIAPVAAAGGGGGCAAFGAATVEGAHAGGFGPFVAGYASSGPGVLSGIVAGEHADMCVAH